MRTIVWFRSFDLRLGDHLPLRAALEGEDVIPLFVFDDDALPLESAHQTQFLLEALESLAAALTELGSRLVVVRGTTTEVLPRLLREFQADRIVAHAAVEPFDRVREASLKGTLGPKFELYDTNRLAPVASIRTQQGQPFSVFTYFARSFRSTVNVDPSAPAPQRLPALPGIGVGAEDPLPRLEEFGFSRNPALVEGGERAAVRRLRRFADTAVHAYDDHRDRMDLPATSRISADLRFGTMSARQAWNTLRSVDTAGARRFRDQLLWREFAMSTLADRPQLLEHPFRPEFEGFPWREDEAGLLAWTTGRTGYPVVDAAARQLLGEGFVHNRARMVAASFLTKHLMIGYWEGERHYMRHLVDADLAQNNLGWQWSAGCGCDAQPYFRVFNPVTQGTKFDPEGDYVRRWVPELAAMPTKFIHRPWEAPASALMNAGVRLGVDYPEPIVEHRFARDRFLSAAKEHLRSMRAAAS